MNAKCGEKNEQLRSDASVFWNRTVNAPQDNQCCSTRGGSIKAECSVFMNRPVCATPQDKQRCSTRGGSIKNLFKKTRSAIVKIVRSRNVSGSDSISSEVAAGAGCFEERPTNSNGGSAESLRSSCGPEDDGQSDRTS